MDVVHERTVEKDEEDTVARVGERLHHVALRARLRARRLRTAHWQDVLERVDLLRHAILEHLEVSGHETLDNSAVLRRIDIDADEVRADADGLLCLSRQDDRADRSSDRSRAPTSDNERHACHASHGYRTTRMALMMRWDLDAPTTSTSMA